MVRALAEAGVSQQLVHTGQHYDRQLSEIFFRQLDLPKPEINLRVGSGSHAQQTAAVMASFEQRLLGRRPKLVVVYGDVNSTLAAALVAAKLRVPVAHVEAGLRSFDLSMPEEVNRVVTDRLSDLHFATSPEAAVNLGREGAEPGRVHLVGNPMIDTLLANLHRLDPARARSAHGLTGQYAVATLHRPTNVDDEIEMSALVKALHQACEVLPVVLPLHPRGRRAMEAAGMFTHPGVRVTEPLGYVEFLSLVRGAAMVITDSGGVQEETTVLGVPCRPHTERPVTISHRTNRLVTRENLPCAVNECLASGRPGTRPVPPLWDGHAGERIARVIGDYLSITVGATDHLVADVP